jgi:mono/diheme cytochrome c family protein
MIRRWHRAVLGLLIVTAVTACRPAAQRPSVQTGTARATDTVARGATLFAAYCGGCHGPRGHGDGPVASVLDMKPADLRAPGLLDRASDEQIVARLLAGEPLPASPRRSAVAEDLQRDAIAAYLPELPRADWPLLRVGRYVFEGACAPCHGAYGEGEGLIGATNVPPPPNLMAARTRHTDDALAALAVDGFGTMPPLADLFAPGEVRAVVAYVRHLSKGYRLYDTYCAACHGDDGRGVHPEDLLPPSTPAPLIDAAALARLGPAGTRARVLHMLQRESGRMPHFRETLDEAQLRDIVAWLRATGESS